MSINEDNRGTSARQKMVPLSIRRDADRRSGRGDPRRFNRSRPWFPSFPPKLQIPLCRPLSGTHPGREIDEAQSVLTIAGRFSSLNWKPYTTFA
jgi:hypothetical protein